MLRFFRGDARSPPLLANDQTQAENPVVSEAPAAGGLDTASSSSVGTVEDVSSSLQKIQQHAADIRKEAVRAVTGTVLSSSKQKVRSAYHAAKLQESDAKQWLAQLSASSKDRPAEDKQKLVQLRLQKLADNLTSAVSAVVKAKADFDAAAKASAANAEASAEAVDAEDDVEAAREQSQLQETGVTDAEVAMHADLADQYHHQVSAVVQEVHGLRSAMCSLASHAASQGQVVDSIEANMFRASDASAKAVDQIQISKDRQTAQLKRIACLLCAALIVSGAIMATTYVQHDNGSQS